MSFIFKYSNIYQGENYIESDLIFTVLEKLHYFSRTGSARFMFDFSSSCAEDLVNRAMQDLALYGTTKQKHCKFSISAVCCTNLCTEGIKHDLLQNIPRLIKDTNFIENEHRLRQADVSVTINIRGIPARLLFMNDNPDKDYEDYKKQKTTKSIRSHRNNEMRIFIIYKLYGTV